MKKIVYENGLKQSTTNNTLGRSMFDILEHLDKLVPDGGSETADSKSFQCPLCSNNNFKVSISSGKWSTFGCDCASTEEGKKKIRHALSPAKSIRIKQERSWIYNLIDGRPAIKVNRTDDGKGHRKFWQESLLYGLKPKDIVNRIPPYRIKDAQKSLREGSPYVFWVEGEVCAEALWGIGLPAITCLGGSKFKLVRDAGLIPSNQVVVVPDIDQVGLKHAENIAAAHKDCKWLYISNLPEDEWPENGGKDIADWISSGANKEQINEAIGPKRSNNPLDQWDQLLGNLVNPEHTDHEKNITRRQIRASTAAKRFRLSVSHQQVRSRLQAKQRELITGTGDKGTSGGCKATVSKKEFLIAGLIPKYCLTGIAAFNKVGKTKLACALASSLIFERPFMAKAEWLPEKGIKKLILWLVDQPASDSCEYLKAVGLMDCNGQLHSQIIKLFTQEDDLCWDDQGIDLLIQLTQENPGVILISDSFFANVQSIHGSDQEPEAGGALIDVQTYLSQTKTTHICLFHSPKEVGPVGINAIRGHSSVGAVVSGVISLHFLEKKNPNGKWVADKESPYRRMVCEGRLPYFDLLVRLDASKGEWEVIGSFQTALADLSKDQVKATSIEKLTEGQKETLDWLSSAQDFWKNHKGVSAYELAACKFQFTNRQPTISEVEVVRKQLKALTKLQLILSKKDGRTERFSFRKEQ